jgi:hypothetical protein
MATRSHNPHAGTMWPGQFFPPSHKRHGHYTVDPTRRNHVASSIFPAISQETWPLDPTTYMPEPRGQVNFSRHRMKDMATRSHMPDPRGSNFLHTPEPHGFATPYPHLNHVTLDYNFLHSPEPRGLLLPTHTRTTWLYNFGLNHLIPPKPRDSIIFCPHRNHVALLFPAQTRTT